ncbi:hypothetical protein EP10_000629 [Geobacillus icigianus]|uniref:Uncharacterized protein n=2 Tax=Anoxybacillaceae TaxID=3120669 RepID=A0ABU6BD86_9BACL|nr:hypothetical protein [Geobacillus icigianus]
MGLPGIAASVCSFKRLVKTNRSLDRWKSQKMMTFQGVLIGNTMRETGEAHGYTPIPVTYNRLIRLSLEHWQERAPLAVGKESRQHIQNIVEGGKSQ